MKCQLQHSVCHATSPDTVAPALRPWSFCSSSHESSNLLRTTTLLRIVRSGGLYASTERLVARISCSASCGCSCNAIIVHKSLKVNLAVEAQEHSITVKHPMVCKIQSSERIIPSADSILRLHHPIPTSLLLRSTPRPAFCATHVRTVVNQPLAPGLRGDRRGAT